jgi:hypothetical protein
MLVCAIVSKAVDSIMAVIRNIFFMGKSVLGFYCSEIQEQHSYKYQGQIYGLALEIGFMEEECSHHETDDDTASAYHTDNTNHSFVHRETVEICQIGSTNEKAYQGNGPAPLEGGFLSSSTSLEPYYNKHNGKLVEVEITLYGEPVEAQTSFGRGREEELVVQSACRSQYGGSNKAQ